MCAVPWASRVRPVPLYLSPVINPKPVTAPRSFSVQESGRGGRDRTGDHLLPKQVRYRCATPRGRRIIPRGTVYPNPLMRRRRMYWQSGGAPSWSAGGRSEVTT
jgi:hypothetical protein